MTRTESNREIKKIEKQLIFLTKNLASQLNNLAAIRSKDFPPDGKEAAARSLIRRKEAIHNYLKEEFKL